MKKPNYAEMRQMLARREAENMPVSDIEEILIFGTTGWNDWENEDLLEEFVKVFGTHYIPKVEVK